MNAELDIQQRNVLVVGDLMVDRYQTGEVRRISPEAPVPIFHLEKERMVLGGAGNVVANLRAAKQKVFIASVIGDDAAGDLLISMLSQQGVSTAYVLREKTRMTTVKTRYIGQNHQQLFRVDEECIDEIKQETCNKLTDKIEAILNGIDIVILSDYGKGVLSEDLCHNVIRLANCKGKRVLVDVKGNNAEKYRGAYLVKPNLAELITLAQRSVDTLDEVHCIAQMLCGKYEYDYILVTLGARGMCLSDAQNIWEEMPACMHDVFDVTGAGDTVVAFLAVALASGMGIKQAMLLSNVAAGIQVTKSGTVAVCIEELQAAIKRRDDNQDLHKLINWEEAAQLHARYPDKKIVFTNGCFDILHAGHISYLRQAAKLGDVLVVGINSDRSVRRLKGATRPINGIEDRTELLAAIAFIDYIVVFEEDTPMELIRVLSPNILVKGGDYQIDKIVGADYVQKCGGIVTTIQLAEGKSTTNTIQKIKQA